MWNLKTIKFLEEKHSTFFDIGLSNFFFDIIFSCKRNKVKINKCDNIKLKGFCTLREILTSVLANYFFCCSKAKEIKAKVNKCDLINLNALYSKIKPLTKQK